MYPTHIRSVMTTIGALARMITQVQNGEDFNELVASIDQSLSALLTTASKDVFGQVVMLEESFIKVLRDRGTDETLIQQRLSHLIDIIVQKDLPSENVEGYLSELRALIKV